MNTEKVRIGYQGMQYSNSMEAAMSIARSLQFTNCEFIPLVTAQGVADALKNREITYGVFAVKNSVAGPVVETQMALAGVKTTLLATESMHIHHCAFTLNGDVKTQEITVVASHVQALDQCANSLQKLFPNANRKELEDTAIAARYLGEGTLPPTTAVICRRDAGEQYHLTCIAANIEDFSENITIFQMMELQDA